MNDARRKLEERISRLTPQQRALFDQRLLEATVSGHVLVARSLQDIGVSHVYAVPGQPTYDTFGELAKHGIRTIGTRHQQPAALMAAAHNYFAGEQKAVTIVSSGVPATNALTGLVVAHDNGWPLVVLAGTSPQTSDVAGYFMSLPLVDICRPITKQIVRVPTSAEIPRYIQRAFNSAMSGRPGPVLVELPEDVLTGMTPPPQITTRCSEAIDQPEAERALVDQAAAAIAAAKRPLLIIGKGLRWAGPLEGLHRLVDELVLPFVSSPEGAGTLSENHPLCMNAVSWIAQEQADLVIVLGARLNWTFRYGNHINANPTVIKVDIHEHEIGRNRAATIGVRAHAGSFLSTLLVELGRMPEGHLIARRDNAWTPALQEIRSREFSRREGLAADDCEPISPFRLAGEIREAIPNDAISIFDGNLTMIACQQVIPASLPASRLTAGTSGCMGVGIPYAIAAKLAQPDRAVVAVCGDYAFGLSVMELESAVRHNIPIVVVVANNDGNSGTRRQNMHLGSVDAERIMMFQPGLRYDKIMDIFGGYSEHIDRPDCIGPALQRALASQRPACINVRVDPNAPFPKI